MDLEAFVLIGGRSRRFGRDKALVEFEGERLAERAVRLIEIAFPGVSAQFVAASEDQFGGDLKGARVFDLRPGFGAWSGLHAALINSEAEWTLVVACDLPYLTTQFLQTLVNERRDDLDAILPRQADGRLQPLCALYRTRTARPVVETVLAEGSQPPPLGSLSEHLRTSVIDVSGDVLKNANTPSDLV